MRDPDLQRALARRLSRIAGQVAGIQRMVDDDRYCVDILVQIAAVRAALGKVGRILLENHIRTCVTEAFEAGEPGERDAKIAELLDVYERFCRT
ncbi:MAG: metal-sensitive transcriptional regulator [Deltaproteobacteria bacterium]|nr:MAG: metal-sensitive transcriptional regulator [Deltaproteobacteria bacterium]